MNKNTFIISILTLILDQASKIIAVHVLSFKKSITIINNFFNLTLVYNRGAAWGLFSDNRIVLTLFTIIAIFIIVNFLKTFKNNIRNNIALGLLLGGMAGNLIDRLFLGYVRDFLDFKILNYNYPVFNISDIAIVISIILLIYAVIKGEDKNGNPSRGK